jgi:hypothetical protein
MSEADLYPAVHDYLEQRFLDRVRPAYGEIRSISAVTATAGGPGSGHWSRPDLALVAIWRTKYALAWSLDLHGFEVKTATGCTPAAVHEALSHAALVHFPHLVWHKADWSDNLPECRAILDRCTRYGVGLITFSDPENSDSFLVRHSARRHSPSGEAVDEFIESRLAQADRSQLTRWIEELR